METTYLYRTYLPDHDCAGLNFDDILYVVARNEDEALALSIESGAWGTYFDSEGNEQERSEEDLCVDLVGEGIERVFRHDNTDLLIVVGDDSIVAGLPLGWLAARPVGD